MSEIAELEKWLLSDIDLCKDIAEFSAFVHALRGGALAQWAVVPEAIPDVQPENPEPPPSVPSEPEPVAPVVPERAPVSPPSAAATDPESPTERGVQGEPFVAERRDSVAPTPEPPTAPTPQSQAVAGEEKKGSTVKGILITGATITCAIILLLMIMIYALRAG